MWTQNAQGAQIRAKAKWVEDGEKSTKYFLDLERKHQINNRITSLRGDNGMTYTKPNDILREGAKFYRKLYNKKNIESNKIDSFLDSVKVDKILTDFEATLCGK